MRGRIAREDGCTPRAMTAPGRWRAARTARPGAPRTVQTCAAPRRAVTHAVSCAMLHARADMLETLAITLE